MQLIAMESIMGIVDYNMRKQLKKSKLMARISDEKELSSALQQHKDDFSAFVCKRRTKGRLELKEIFQSGSGIALRFGDLISSGALDTISAFETSCLLQLAKDGIAWELIDIDDMPTFITRQIRSRVFLISDF